MTEKIPYYLALDPGGSTGWATFTEDGHGITMGTCKTREQVYELLRSVNPSFIICEDWITKQDARLGGDKLEVVRVIGAVEFYAYIKQIPIVEQPNTIKGIGYKWAGLSQAKSKAHSHERDAYVHGVYYLQKRGIRKPQQGRAPVDGLDLKLNIRSTGSSYPREATVIPLSEVIKAIEDAVAPYGLGIYSMKQARYIEFPIVRTPRNE